MTKPNDRRPNGLANNDDSELTTAVCERLPTGGTVVLAALGGTRQRAVPVMARWGGGGGLRVCRRRHFHPPAYRKTGSPHDLNL